jgi:muramoyltetrapeptide carboxypeptidase LdcA involved in peptidoglycan recycling
MRYPSFIEKGNTIGFVAPSFGCAGEPYYSAFQNSLKKWNALGFKTELGFNCYASDGVGISSSPKKCAAEFMEYYKKETVNWLHNNYCYVEHSILTEDQKQKIKNNIIF